MTINSMSLARATTVKAVRMRDDEPEEARYWPLKYQDASKLKVGDYLISMGRYHRVNAMMFSQIELGQETSVYADGFHFKSYNYAPTTCWALVKPE